MNKKKMWILLIISLVMIMSISAISAADKNETLRGDVSHTNDALREDVSHTNDALREDVSHTNDAHKEVNDANDALREDVSHTNDAHKEVNDAKITKTSVPSEQEDNATSPMSEKGNDVEKNSVSNNKDELSNQKGERGASSNLNKGLLSASASNDDLLGENPNFYYNNKWYGDLDDAVDDACDNGGGTILLTARAWGYDSAERHITISDGVSITFQPYNSGDTVIFDGQGHKYWFFKITDGNAHITFRDITFRNGGDGSDANDGGAIRIQGGQLNLYNCIFKSNEAAANNGGGYGCGGAIWVDDGASLYAEDCQFIDNWAGRYGGAICIEDYGSATLKNCYFKGNTKGYESDHNKVANDFDEYDIDSGASADWSFEDCLFVGSGSLVINVNAVEKSVTITPLIDDGASLVVLYKDGSYYREEPGSSGYPTTFTGLDKGSYTVYMMKEDSQGTKRYEYAGNTFSINENTFVLNGEQVFENLGAAVDAIPSGGSGVITVEGGTYTEQENFGVVINGNKNVTIKPKDDSLEQVIFSTNSYQYNHMLKVCIGCHLIMEDITITGLFNNALNFDSGSYGTISNCEFENIYYYSELMKSTSTHPIKMSESNVVLNDCTFESNGNIWCSQSTLNIDDCTFTSNSYANIYGSQGGAIRADSSSNVTVTNSEFNSNEAINVAEEENNAKGGAIYATKLKVDNTKFIGNGAGFGAAIYIAGDSNDPVNITNCVFDSNVATEGYRHIYSESATRIFNLELNEYDVNIKIDAKDGLYGEDYILEGDFDWGCNLDNNYTFFTGTIDDGDVVGDLVNIEDSRFKINTGVLSGGTHEFAIIGMFAQEDSNDYFYTHRYHSDLYGNQFYIDKDAYAKILIDKAKITLTLDVKDVLIPETPVLNVEANWDLNYTIFIGNKYYPLEVVNGKGSMPLTGLDLGNYTVVGMRDTDENYYFVMNFTTFSVDKTYSNFLVISTNVEYDTLNEAVANSNNEDTIYVKNGTYTDTGIVISDKVLDIIALNGAVFDAQGRDANFIIINENAVVDIYGITFRGLHNRNTNYGAIVNHGYLSLDSCNFIDNKITKTSFAENGGAAIFNDGSSLEIDNCNFINNIAPLRVSTAAVTSVSYDDVSITSSKFINNSAREGGALHFKNITQFEAAVTSCDFEQNTAVKGSAIYVGNNSRYLAVTLSDFRKNNIKNNLGENAQLEGGVIYVNANNDDVFLDISLSNFEDNSNKNVDGGVICLDGSSNANIENCIFNNNRGKTGSAILIKNPYNKKLTLFIDGSVFTNNDATNGAIATSPKVTTLIDEGVFANNTGENRNIYSNGFTVVHDSIFDVKGAELNALSVQYGKNSIINGTADFGTNLYAAANLTVAGENVTVEIKNNKFTYETGILHHGKYYAVLNNIVDNNNNTYLMDSITEIFRVNNIGFDLDVSVDNITYGETIKVVEKLPPNVTGTIDYQLNGKYYTKEELESLKLDAGKYTLAAIYDHEDFAFTSSIINFEVYKANPTISVADVEVEYNDTIIVNIETNVPSIYIIEIEDYKIATLVNGSKAVKIDKTFEPGTYTIKVTSQERVNYISNFTEAILKVNKKLATFMLSVPNRVANLDDAIIEVSAPDNAVGNIAYTISDSNNKIVYTVVQSCRDDLTIPALDDGDYEINAVFEGDDLYSSNNIQKTSLSIKQSVINFNNENIHSSGDTNSLGDGYDEYKFIYQYDEDSDYEYYETLADAMDEAMIWGAGTIIVRGGTYSGYGFCGIYLEGEMEITIKAYEGEEVIFDCENDDYFMHLTYETVVEPSPNPPLFFETYQTEGPTVTLDNITVINGCAINGGAIDIDAGTLILTNCTFRNNNANCGGAIYIGSISADEGATVIGYNTTFTNNYASDEGGAIYIGGALLQDISASFYLCTFLDNYQGEDDERQMNYFGGDNTDEITSQYCIFNGNGVINSFVMDKINQTVTVNGTSSDVFDSVVLLYFDQVPLYTINNYGSKSFNVTFEDVIGGNYTLGVMDNHKFNTYVFEECKFEMKVPNFIISEDEVYENLTDAIYAVAENGIIYANANYHIDENMEIDIHKSFTLKNFRGRDVVFDGNSEKWFFTIAEGSTVVFDGIYFTDGAIKTCAAIENYGNLILKNCSFDGFETGTIIYNSGSLNILNSTFSLNFVDNALVWNDEALFIDTVVFSDNIVNINSVVYNNGVTEIVSSNFTENYNGGNGGAIYNTNSLSVKDTVFNENEGSDGGAIYNTGILQVLNSTFEDNTANGYGGAIYNGNELNIFNSTFTGSSSEKDGGAIYNNHTMTVDNSTFVANSATGNGGAIYNNKSLELTKSFFGINFAEEFANIYNNGDIQFSENIFDFYDVILIVPDGQYGINTTITGTLNPEFNMDLQVTLPGFVNNEDAPVTISDGVFEYVTDILPKGIYAVKLDEIIYDNYGNIYYGESIIDRLIVYKANVYINLTVEDVIIQGTPKAPVLNISASQNGLFYILFNNKLSNVTINDGHYTLDLEAVGEGNYTVLVFREGNENYNDATNTTKFKVSEYEGKFIVNSTSHKFDTLREALEDSSNDDIIYVREGTYSGADNLELTILDKKLTIISLGDVIFDAKSTDLSFLTIKNSEVTIWDVVITGFNTNKNIIYNEGNLTVDGCIFINNTLAKGGADSVIISSKGNLSIVDSGFYDNILSSYLILSSSSELIINESTFENNTISSSSIIYISDVDSAKIISNEFVENIVSQGNIIEVINSKDILISSAFYNNTQSGNVIYAYNNTNLIVDNSTFTGNTLNHIISSEDNNKNTISGCIFTDNAVCNVVLSNDKNLSVIESTFSNNKLSDKGALNIASEMNASVNSSIFSNNIAENYRNIYSSCDVNISNSVFDALNVDYTVHDIDYGQTETIEGSIDIGTNLKFAVNLDINSNSHSVNVTDNKFTYNTGILNGGDYKVVLNAKDGNSNSYIFDKITKMFTVNRVDPELSVSIADITRGEKLKVNLTISKGVTANVVYELGGKAYTKKELENLTLNQGNYLVTAMYRGDKNYLQSTKMVSFEVQKIAPNITVSDVAVDYNEEVKIDVAVDVTDYYTVFLGNESITLYVENNTPTTFKFSPSVDLKPGNYTIKVYVFETDDYAEAYAYANLTVNKATGSFNLSNDIITYGENATITVKVPVNANGNITYNVTDENGKLVYSITQSCLKELVVPNLSAGRFIVKGNYSGDSYYTNKSIINPCEIFVNTKGVDLNITVSNITYGEDAIVKVKSNVDGEYIVYVGNKPMQVTVIGGTGKITVSNLNIGNYNVNVTIVDDNYHAYNTTTFNVVPKKIPVTISVEDITYGENAVIKVKSSVDGEYIVYVGNTPMQVTVMGGTGNVAVSNLNVGSYDVNVTIVDDNYHAYNTTTFNVVRKEIPVTVSVENIIYGETATVKVKSSVDGEYIVYVGNTPMQVTVMGGTGNVAVSNLNVGSYDVNVTIVDGNYSAYDTTRFNVVRKEIPVTVSIENITYGDDAVVNIESSVDGDYIVTIRDVNYTVSVNGGNGVKIIPNLSVGNQIVATVKREDNYAAFNETTFNINQKQSNVKVTVKDITYSEDVIVTVQSDVDGDYIVTIRDVNYTVSVNGGNGVKIIPNLDAGKNILVSASIADGNYSAYNTTTFNIASKTTSVAIYVEDIAYGENAVIKVKSSVDGEYIVYVGNKPINVNVINGAGNVAVSNLNVGSYDVNVTIDDDNYNVYNTTTFKVVPKQLPTNSANTPTNSDVSPSKTTSKLKTKIVSKKKTFKRKVKTKKYKATLKFGKKRVPRVWLYLTLNTKKYTKTFKASTKKGVAKFKASTKKGKFKATIRYNGNNKYKVTVKYGKKALRKVKVTITIKGKKYKKTFKAKTNKKGIATFKIKKLTKGKYTATIKYTAKKTFKAKTNKKGIATFKIKKLNKKGKYNAIIRFKGNNKYNASKKTVKIGIK